MKAQSAITVTLRFALALLGLFGCYRLMVGSAKAGYSRLLLAVSYIQSGIEPADAAVRLTPTDPEAHYTRALALVNHNRLNEAVVDFQQAIRLRPYHYYQRLDLGVTLDRLGDQEGALAALKESVRLAPSFAQPRWQLGSHLYRQKKYQEAFLELQLGAKSNPNLSSALLDLAWVAADGDVPAMELLINPKDTTSHLGLANYLAKRGNGSDAVRHAIAAGTPHDEVDRSLLRGTIKALLATNHYRDAYAVWATTHNLGSANGAQSSPQVVNADFRDPIPQDDPGFGWQLSASPNVSVSIDPSGPVSGSQSILFNFNGESAPGTGLLYQIVLVKPKTHYLLHFMSRTENLVTGGPPVIMISNPSSAKTLGQSKSLPTGTVHWTQVEVDFSTDEKTEVIMMSVQRLGCNQAPCPVFGKFWLSKFSLTEGSNQ
jgi:tetratricopeptide (TPR) repeat protein